MAVSASAIVRRTRDGTLSSPTPGNNITMAPTRAKVSMKAVARAGKNEISIRIGPVRG